ncbi:DUF4177 domain-containing protein [Defluviimonas sp. WL0050]|uniref:DUF4177 domain-containing protein n=1 Tax=Albidovulum litorale TaxID=2984134 RepID=A0ABT2ZQY4_9RHOB|nr:DUF4177 domain-containing protein [Defluviimonas sp. WL0050]MCV2873572.1 DUF4177 domain-containing protein [Defluviimonas sp. WL0050]
MQQYEYRVIPAPNRGEKAPGVKTGPDRFAHALASVMNELARDGWEYLRADTLPSEERSGLTKRTTVYHSVLVFRRAVPRLTEEAPRRVLTAAQPQGRAPALTLEPSARKDRPAEPQTQPAGPERESR